MEKPSTQFAGLHLLRLGALALVFLYHLEFLKHYYTLSNNLIGLNNFHLGDMAVTALYTLSGFLITYHLLNNPILDRYNIFNFYKKRFVKIIPGYILLLVVALVGFPFFSLWNDFSIYTNGISRPLLYLTLLPYVDFMYYNKCVLSHTWFIGAIALFYLVWPHFLKNKNALHKIGLFILLFVVLKFILFFLSDSSNPFMVNNTAGKLFQLFYLLRFECAGVGGLAAYWLIANPKLISNYFTVKSALILLASIFVFLYFINYIPYPNFIFSILIGCLCLMFTQLTIKSSRLKVILSKINVLSFGIYLWHFPVQIGCIVFLIKYNLNTNYTLFIVATIITILIAAITTILEKRLLKKLFP